MLGEYKATQRQFLRAYSLNTMKWKLRKNSVIFWGVEDVDVKDPSSMNIKTVEL